MEEVWGLGITLLVIAGGIGLAVALGWLLLSGLLRAAFYRVRASVRRLAERRRSRRQAAAERRLEERRS